jgi:hypothetical protein
MSGPTCIISGGSNGHWTISHTNMTSGTWSLSTGWSAAWTNDQLAYNFAGYSGKHWVRFVGKGEGGQSITRTIEVDVIGPMEQRGC